MTLNSSQFNIEHPFPRLRHAYAKNWAHGWANMLRSEGELVSDEGLYDEGIQQANFMVEMALNHNDPDNAKWSRKQLYRTGFQKRRSL